MPNPQLTERMTDYFERQIAWFETLKRKLPDTERNWTDEEWSRLAEDEAADRRQTVQLEEEFYLLQREWNAAEDISEEEKAHVRKLAQEAKGLADELSGWFEEGERKAAEARDETSEELNRARKGRSMLNKYRGANGEGAEWIDRQA